MSSKLRLALLPLVVSGALAQSTVTVTETVTTVLDLTSVLTSTKTLTNTVVSTGPATTVTCLNSAYTASAPVVTVTVLETDTSTNVVTHTEIESTTTVVTTQATATSVVPNGLAYRRYDHPFDANLPLVPFTSSFFKNDSLILHSGVLQTLTFRTSGNGNLFLQLPDNSAPFFATQSGILFQGFFVAKSTGNYSLSIAPNSIDNWGFLWTGPTAISGWDDSNTVIKATRVGSGPYIGGSTHFSLKAGDTIPITWLWANGGGPGSAEFRITSPNGDSTLDGTGYFVKPCTGSGFP